MIRHSVIFTLKHRKGSPGESDFFTAAARLANLPGVLNFEILRQVSAKNDFDYGLSMTFESTEAYTAYNQHPGHTKFIDDYWIKDVAQFLEIDFTAMD